MTVRARRERPVDRRVIRRDELARYDDTVGGTIERRRARDIRELSRRHVEIVAHDDVESRYGADVRRLHDVFERRARERGPATDDGNHLRDSELLHVADDDDGRLGARRGIAVAVGQEVRRLERVDDGLVDDQRAGRHTVVDEQIEGHDRGLALRQRALPRAWYGRRQIARAHVDAGDEWRGAAVGLLTGKPFNVSVSATYVVFAGTVSRSKASVAGWRPLL